MIAIMVYEILIGIGLGRDIDIICMSYEYLYMEMLSQKLQLCIFSVLCFIYLFLMDTYENIVLWVINNGNWYGWYGNEIVNIDNVIPCIYFTRPIS